MGWASSSRVLKYGNMNLEKLQNRHEHNVHFTDRECELCTLGVRDIIDSRHTVAVVAQPSLHNVGFIGVESQFLSKTYQSIFPS